MNWPDDGKLYVPHLIEDIWKATGGGAIIATDVGQHQMWTAQYYALDKPNRWLTSGGAGTMGFGLPSAIGAWFADKEQEVWAVAGDGGFQMTAAELTTAVAQSDREHARTVDYCAQPAQRESFTRLLASAPAHNQPKYAHSGTNRAAVPARQSPIQVLHAARVLSASLP